MKNEDLKEYYEKRYVVYGDNPQSLQYPDRDAQNRRFELLLKPVLPGEKVMDLGCGLGDMMGYIEAGNLDINYVGLDFVESFVNSAKARFSNTELFKHIDLMKGTFPTDCDYAIASGIFNNKTSDNDDFLYNTLEKMFAACKKGICFNALSTYVEYHDDDLYYVDPRDVFDFVKRKLTPKVELKHDYELKENGFPYEFTIYAYK